MALFRSGKPRLKVTLAADYAAAAGTYTVPYDTLAWSEGDITFPTGTAGEVSVDVPGTYLMVASYRKSAGAGSYGLSLQVNGVTKAQAVLAMSNTTVDSQWTVTGVEPLVAGDVVRVRGTIGGTAPVIEASGTFLTLVRIGPKWWT